MALLETALALVAAFFSVAFLSFLYRDNAFFKFGEHTLLGIQMGIILISTYKSIVSTGFQPLLVGKYVMIIPVLLGFAVYTTYSKKTRPVSFIPMAVLVGIGVGLGIRGAITGQFVQQIVATIQPIATKLSLYDNVNNFIIIVATISSLAYFVFTREQRGSFGRLTNVGRYFIMIATGVQFGSMSLTFLSPGITPALAMFTAPGTYITAIATIVIAFDIFRRKRQSPK